MVFKSDKQRKAVMAKLNTNVRSNVSPQPVKISKSLRQRLVEFRKRRVEARERKGQERIEKEKRALEVEKIQAERLRAELEVEQARETVAMQRRETQEEFRRIRREKIERRIAPIKKGIARTIATAKAIEKRTRPKKRKAIKRRTRILEQDFFRI